MYCIHCGFKNDADAKFCANCGMPIELELQSVKEEVYAEGNNRRPIVIIVAVAAVLILAGAGFGAWHVFVKNTPSDNGTVAETEIETETETVINDSTDFDDEGDNYSNDDQYGDYDDEADDDYAIGQGHSDDIIPYSSDELLTDEDIDGLTKDQIQIAANEIYARHGAIFETEEAKDYFCYKSWYYPEKSQEEARSEFSKIEKKNADFLHERALD